jgi:hypothetical protein
MTQSWHNLLFAHWPVSISSFSMRKARWQPMPRAPCFCFPYFDQHDDRSGWNPTAVDRAGSALFRAAGYDCLDA